MAGDDAGIAAAGHAAAANAGAGSYNVVCAVDPSTGYRLPDGVIDFGDVMLSWRVAELATALASMTAKYLRELHMIQFNAYFQARVPGLKPTAGYGLDAWRFLDDIAAARAADGLAGPTLLRTR